VLLALRRLFGFADTAAAEEAADRDWRSRKWVIEPTQQGIRARIEEFWRYRRILWFLVRQRVRDRYEGMTLGPFWLLARPLAPILIGTLVFGGLLGVPSERVPYFLFFLTGTSCWRIFERSLMWVTRGLEKVRGLVKKVYFPRIIAPIAAVSPALAEFAAMLGLLLLAAIFYWFKDGVMYLQFGPRMLVAVLAIVLTVFFSISVGLFTAVLQVRHRDVRYSLRYVNQFWMYATPVIYPMSQIPPKYHFLMYINPMAPLVETYKWGMLGIGEFPAKPLATATVVMAAVFVTGVVFFYRSEAASVDRM